MITYESMRLMIRGTPKNSKTWKSVEMNPWNQFVPKLNGSVYAEVWKEDGTYEYGPGERAKLKGV